MMPLPAEKRMWFSKRARIAVPIAFVVALACGSAPRAPAASGLFPPEASAARPVASADASAGPEELHDRVASEVLAALGDHDFDAVLRLFDERMKQEVPKEKLARVFSRLVAAKGEMRSWSFVERSRGEGYDQLRFALNLENGRGEALITFAPGKTQVMGLMLLSR
jgi:uncharacterized protein DUF3887